MTSYKYLGFVLNDNGNLLDHLEERMKNAQQLQCFILSKITSSKGLTPKNASFLIKATFNQMIAYGLETVPMTRKHIDDVLIRSLEII